MISILLRFEKVERMSQGHTARGRQDVKPRNSDDEYRKLPLPRTGEYTSMWRLRRWCFQPLAALPVFCDREHGGWRVNLTLLSLFNHHP